MAKVNRRMFLKTLTAGAAVAVGFPYIIPSSALGKAGTVAPSNRIVFGSIGLGFQGTFNMQTFLSMPDVQVVALCDVEKQADLYLQGYTRGLLPAQKLVQGYYAQQSPSGTWSGCDTYVDFRELLAREDIDAVTVCPPDHWHGLISIAAAKAGKDIYCEKPLTNSVAEGRAVVDAVKKYNRILQTGSHERSTDSARFGCELVRNGYIGKLHTIRINMPAVESHHEKVMASNQHQLPDPIPKTLDYNAWLGPAMWRPYVQNRCHFWWRFVLDFGGGEMTDRGAHIIDLAQLGAGYDHTGPVQLTASGTRAATGIYNTFWNWKWDCTYPDGVRMIGGTDEPRGVKFEGDKGWVFIHVHGGRLEAQPESLLDVTIKPEELRLGRSPLHQRNFVDAIRTRSEPFAPAEVGHRTATVCHLLNIAMLTGETLHWDPVTERLNGNPDAARMLMPSMRSPWHL